MLRARTKMYWNQYSERRLAELEETILSTLKSPYKTFYVPVKFETGSEEQIWTISLNTESQKTPLVLVHGFAGGIGFWCRNLDALSRKRPVYAMDLLGFGRSSRPPISYESSEGEKQMINTLEEWRKKMNLEKFYLLGHSMGGFLTTSYTLSYPERVSHLILADPWGFVDHSHEKVSYLSELVNSIYNIKSLEIVRALGPIGPWLIRTVRSDIATKFEDILDDSSVMPNYVYQCNSQNPTGERALYNMIWGYGWAKQPLLPRMDNLKPNIPITFIYGEKTWMDTTSGKQVADMRPDSFVDIKVIEDAGHHLYSEEADAFNEAVTKACDSTDAENVSEPAIHLSGDGGIQLEMS